MDSGTAATATPSHIHHLESPLCLAPPSQLPPNVDCRVLPPLRQQRADANTLTSSSPRQRATAPPPPPFNKILSIDKRRQTTGDGRGRSIGGRGGWRRGNGIHLAGGERAKNGGDADEARSAAAAATADAVAVAVLADRLSA
jgi:hypothetical protein